MEKPPRAEAPNLTSYQKLVIALLAFLQFTVILDFMTLSPLGATLMPALGISPSQFSRVVSAYAFSAGISGFLAAGFADRFDRKKFLLFFYVGFVIATFFCGLARDYASLLLARMVTGSFGGVIGSIVFAIATDLFPLEMRGRVMGVVQTAFAASQVLGIPLGLFVSNRLGWHAPFFMIAAMSVVVGGVMLRYLRPINAHLLAKPDRSPIHHLLQTLSTPRYLQGFAATALLSTGGFMLMPFGSLFSVRNLGLTLEQLPIVYLITGACAIVAGPLMGRMADRVGKFPVFASASLLMVVMVVIYTHLAITPIAVVILISVLIFVGISGRMISAQALMTAIPRPVDRGAYMSVSASIQQISGGLATALAGVIVVQNPQGILNRYDLLGYVVAVSTLVTISMMYFINRSVESASGNPRFEGDSGPC